jgi:phospholipase C
MLPYNLTGQIDGDLDHGWVGDHEAWNGGLWNNWAPAKTEETMGAITSRSWRPPARIGCTSGPGRRLAGSATRTVAPAGPNAGPVPVVTAALRSTAVELTLANDGKTAIVYTATRNDYEGSTKKVTLTGGRTKTVSWPANQDGYYDVVITANTSDGFAAATRAASPERQHQRGA